MPLIDSLNALSDFSLVIVLGPTATGKTALAIELAQALNTEIINFDSVQVYRHMDIGTAKPSKDQLSQVPHHLIDCCEPNESFTAGDFRRRALEILLELSKTKKAAVLVGGTGFYLQALLKGMYPVTSTDEEVKLQIQERFEKEGREALYKALTQMDPEYASSIHPNDTYRLLRGFEIWEQFGVTPSELVQKFESQSESLTLPKIQIGLTRERAELEALVRQRTQSMIRDGLLSEVQGLLDRYGTTLRVLGSVGYKEACDVLSGKLAKESLEDAIVTSTMQLAKRQKTWFKRDPSIHWFNQKPTLREIENLTKVSFT